MCAWYNHELHLAKTRRTERGGEKRETKEGENNV